jgi:uncharacterized protein
VAPSWFGSVFSVVPLTTNDGGHVADLVEAYADVPLGTADALVIAVAERLGIPALATLDQRHFGVVRSRHVGAFTLPPGRVAPHTFSDVLVR